jgi:hypothetical protein
MESWLLLPGRCPCSSPQSGGEKGVLSALQRKNITCQWELTCYNRIMHAGSIEGEQDEIIANPIDV